jgi:hypothetical protein
MNQPSKGKRVTLWYLAGTGAVLVAAGVVFWTWYSGSPEEDDSQVQHSTSANDLPTQVKQFCGECHAYPPPKSFPRSAWKKEVEQGYQFFAQSDLSMRAPPIEDVIKYYEDRAPPELPAIKVSRAKTPLPVKFTPKTYPVPPGASSPAISNVNLVHLFDKERLDVLACDMRHGLVMVLRPYLPSPRWQILARVSNPAHAEVVDLDGDGNLDILVANLGSFEPTDLLSGSVIWLRGNGKGRFTPVTLLDGVGRVADVQACDFQSSGKKDLVVGVFGWRNTGEILYLENKTKDWSRPVFKSWVLDDRHGTIHVPVVDINKDGRPDFIALISQEHETIIAFINEGKGRFRKETIYTAEHPAYGSSGIQVVDLDGDGWMDVLYTNGDVLDKPYILKPYHGVQWLRNPGRGRFPFEHHRIGPMYGVHRAIAAPFTGMGKGKKKQDIVAVSFLPIEGFPQRKKLGLDAIVFLEQIKPGKFVRHPLETVTCDHVTCAAGDIFHTGRIDLVVGQYCSTKCDYAITIWKNDGPGAVEK